MNQEFCPLLIGLNLEGVMSTIKFHDQLLLKAAEIHDIAADGMLAAELSAIDLPGTQTGP